MVAKKNLDFIDKWIQSIHWKVGNFSMLPIFFGTLMALLDIMMMGSVKMISKGSMPSSWGIPLTVGIYALEPLIFLKALNYEGMVVTNLVWNLIYCFFFVHSTINNSSLLIIVPVFRPLLLRIWKEQ